MNIDNIKERLQICSLSLFEELIIYDLKYCFIKNKGMII